MNDICTTFVITAREGDSSALNDTKMIDGLLRRIIVAAKCTKIGELSHQFTPQGISAIALLAESHLAIHTWPENGSAYITLTTCKRATTGLGDMLQALIASAFHTASVTVTEVPA